MTPKLVKSLHIWTQGDASVGIQSESAEISTPGWLFNSEDCDEADFKEALEAFRAQVIKAFQVAWPDEKITAMFDFEIAEQTQD